MKVLLVNPGWGQHVSRKGRRFNRAWPPLSLLYTGALLERAGARVRLLDGRVERNWRQSLARLADRHDRIVLTSTPLDRWQCPNLEIDVFVGIARSLPSEKLVITGAHGTLFPEAMLEQTGARGVVLGEPEQTVPALLAAEDWRQVPGVVFRQGESIVTTGPPPPVRLDELPPPALHLIQPGRYVYELLGRPFALFETSRGCPYECRFCLKVMYGRGVRFKSVGRVMEEVERAVVTFGFRFGYFIDLEFTTNRDRVLSVCDGLISGRYPFEWCCQTRADAVDEALLRQMKRAGCRLIHYGVESGSPRILETVGKRTSLEAIERAVRLTGEAGMESACFFMAGFPGESRADMERTLAFARRLNPTYASFHAATPYPGTGLGAPDGPCVPCGENRMGFPASHPGHDPAFLARFIRRAYRTFYLRPAYVTGRLRRGALRSMMGQVRLFAGFTR